MRDFVKGFTEGFGLFVCIAFIGFILSLPFWH